MTLQKAVRHIQLGAPGNRIDRQIAGLRGIFIFKMVMHAFFQFFFESLFRIQLHFQHLFVEHRGHFRQNSFLDLFDGDIVADFFARDGFILILGIDLEFRLGFIPFGFTQQGVFDLLPDGGVGQINIVLLKRTLYRICVIGVQNAGRVGHGNNIALNLQLDENLPTIRTEGSQVQQVLLNLIENALDAVGSDGQIDIITTRTKDELHVQIADNGPGIKPEVMKKLWEPFFTTKEPGKGTGLGLSICSDIAHKLGGTITAENRPQGGAVFTLKLPLRG